MQGYRTGHVYRQPLVRPKSSMSQSTVINNEDIATPPAATAVGLVCAMYAYYLSYSSVSGERERTRLSSCISIVAASEGAGTNSLVEQSKCISEGGIPRNWH